jgi:hypothetical protein
MKRDLSKWVVVGLFVTALTAFGYGASTAYAASRERGAAVCQFCSSTPECDKCCRDEDHQGGTCTMAGVCLCF